jgi:hypothetical protein
MGVLIRFCVVIVVALGGGMAGTIRLEAQGVSTPGLTAAFLFNFAKFTTWPDDALRNGSTIVVCVSGHDQVADALVQLTTNKLVEGHPLAIRRTDLRQPLTECHIMFAASLDENSARELLRAAGGHPILTVSDWENFAARGAVANFFIEGARMRFAVNPDAADRVRLRISSRLLTLAKLVRDPSGPR